MFKSNSISLAASLALVGSLTFVGCGSDSSGAKSSNAGDSSSPAQTTTQSAQQVETGSISGVVKLIDNPSDRTIRSSSATSQIVAYNLDDNTQYTTTSTSSGEYDFSGLTEGKYQLVATSTSTTMRSVRQTTVKRDTRSVVNLVLQAAGTIKGSIANYKSYYNQYSIVSIPGTSYISTIDSSGNFELINVPVGDVTIALQGYESGQIYQNVTVSGGEESAVTLEFPTYSNQYASLATDSTLVLYHDGITVRTDNSYTLAQFKELVSLENNSSEALDIVVEYAYDGYDETQYTNYFKVKTSSVVDAGTYTLKLDNTDAFSKEFTIVDKVVVYGDTYTSSAGIYTKELGLAFSNPVADLNSSAITVSYVDEANATQVLPLSGVEAVADRENEYILLGDFATGVAYKVSLDSSIAEGGLFYANGEDNYYEDALTLGDTRVSYVSINESEVDVPLDREIRFSVYNAESLDLQTLKVILGKKELTLKNGGLSSYYGNNYYSDTLEIRVNSDSLVYSKAMSMSIIADDSYGEKVLDRSVSFTTITPATVGVMPYREAGDDSNDWESNLFNNMGVLKAYFNVAIASQSGSITLHDNTHDKDVAVNSTASMNQLYSNNTTTSYYVEGYPEELLPNTEYTMSVSGYTATDGTEIEAMSNTFTMKGRKVISTTVRNGQLLYADYLNDRVEFTIFGKLSDAEKSSLVNGLDITSFNTAMPEDKSHPTPLALWDETSPYSSKLVLAFTIDSGNSYELAFSGDVAKELEMIASKLTFMTQADTVADTSGVREFDIIQNAYFYQNAQDSNLSKVPTTATGQVSVTIPYIIDGSYNSSSSTQCSNLKYKNIYNYSGYDAPDVNASLITEWISGSDVNVTSTSLSGMSYNSHYYSNGNSSGYYYSCDITYNANFSSSNEANSSVTIEVPQSALSASDIVADNFVAYDTNQTIYVPSHEGVYTGFNIYSNSFDISFSKPVSVASLEKLVISTNPNLNIEMNEDYGYYYDAEGNRYTTYLSGSFDSSAYSAFGYEVNSTLSYYDVYTQTTKDLNLAESGVVYTTADLTPLEVSSVTSNANQITLDVSRAVDNDSVLSKDTNGTIISSAFTLSNENNDSNVTAAISSVSSNYNYTTNTNSVVLSVSRSDSESGCYDAMSFALTQAEAIKAEGSTQTLDAGSVTATINLPAESYNCPEDNNSSENNSSL